TARPAIRFRRRVPRPTLRVTHATSPTGPAPRPPRRRARRSRPQARGTEIAGSRLGTCGTRRGDRRGWRQPSLRHRRLVPANIQRHRHHEITLADERMAILVLFVLRGRDHPDVAVVVAAEFALWVRTVGCRREETRIVERADEVLVVVAEHSVEF